MDPLGEYPPEKRNGRKISYTSIKTLKPLSIKILCSRTDLRKGLSLTCSRTGPQGDDATVRSLDRERPFTFSLRPSHDSTLNFSEFLPYSPPSSRILLMP
ncbi:unnamed protein product [Nesidiocoris tenuis]|uniref:Uncharacterized protein n=1 Tax=Nesidiocoris tenuis TaxID=355587 RepID=A0A6H5HPM0_9HEMI|nr:unnamed protein product [Nesidiocoris tenuis]